MWMSMNRHPRSRARASAASMSRRPSALPLPGRVDRQHPEIRAIAAAFQIHATGQGSSSGSSSASVRRLQHQKFAAGVHERGDLVCARAIADLEKCFDDERVVDDPGQRRGIV